jgi:WD40 repeat protein
MQPHSEPVMQHGTAAFGVRFSRDSRYLASSANDPGYADSTNQFDPFTLKLWATNGNGWTEVAVVANMANGKGNYKSDISFSPNGKIVGVGLDSSLRFYAAPGLQLITNLAPGSHPAFSDDGRTLLHTVIERRRSVIERERYRIVRRDSPTAPEIVIGEQPGRPAALAVSLDGSLAASSSEQSGGAIDLWQVRQRRHLATLKGHEHRVVSLTFSPDGKTLASASWDGKLGLWDVASQRKLGLLRGHNGEVSCAAFSPDGRTIVTSGRDATMRFWNVETRQEMFVLRGRKLNVNSVAFSPDGQWLAAACQDGAIRLWRAPTLEEFQINGRPGPAK